MYLPIRACTSWQPDVLLFIPMRRGVSHAVDRSQRMAVCFVMNVSGLGLVAENVGRGGEQWFDFTKTSILDHAVHRPQHHGRRPRRQNHAIRRRGNGGEMNTAAAPMLQRVVRRTRVKSPVLPVTILTSDFPRSIILIFFISVLLHFIVHGGTQHGHFLMIFILRRIIHCLFLPTEPDKNATLNVLTVSFRPCFKVTHSW